MAYTKNVLTAICYFSFFSDHNVQLDFILIVSLQLPHTYDNTLPNAFIVYGFAEGL